MRIRHAFAALCLALAGGGMAAMSDANATPTPAVALDCVAQDGLAGDLPQALCDALAAQLAQADPPWSAHPPADAPPGAARMTLHLLAASKHELRASLAWQRGPASGESPEHTLSASDTALRPAMFGPFVGTLLHSSDWPG